MLNNLIMPSISFAAGFACCAFLLSAPNIETSSQFKVGDCVRQLGYREVEKIVAESKDRLEFLILAKDIIYSRKKLSVSDYIKVDCPKVDCPTE